MNENKNAEYQNLWDAVKIVLRRKSAALSAYGKKRSQINHLIFQPRKLEKKKK